MKNSYDDENQDIDSDSRAVCDGVCLIASFSEICPASEQGEFSG